MRAIINALCGMYKTHTRKADTTHGGICDDWERQKMP